MNERSSKKLNDDRRDKKAYHRPELLIYGSIREITRAVGNKGAFDGGSGMTDKS